MAVFTADISNFLNTDITYLGSPPCGFITWESWLEYVKKYEFIEKIIFEYIETENKYKVSAIIPSTYMRNEI